MSLPVSPTTLPLKVEDYCSEFTSDLSLPPLDPSQDHDHAADDRSRRTSVSSVGTIPSPTSPTFPQSAQDELEDCWNLIPYNVPWGHNYHNYEYGTLPGPEGACIFLRSPTPVKSQRTSQACKKCRERKAKCSGTRPSCERCLARGHACVYVDDPKRVRRAASANSLGRRSHHLQSLSVSSLRTPPQSIAAESPLDDAYCSSPSSPVIGIMPSEQDFEADLSTPVEYEGKFHPVIHIPDDPYTFSIQSAALGQSPDPTSAAVLSPQPMRYPQLGSLLSVSVPGGDEVPSLDSTSSSPASSSSQSTPLLGYQTGMYDPGFIAGGFGYDRSTQFPSYYVPRSVQYSQFEQNTLALPMGCSFDENPNQVYNMGGNGEHLLASTEGLSQQYNEDLLVRPQFIPY